LPHLEIVDVRAAYGGPPVLEKVSMAADRGEIVSLIGPSGSGKSTLLRVLVGLLKPAAGVIRLDGKVVDYADKTALRQVRDRIAIVFQQYNLFQNMSVLRNVSIAPVKVKKRPRAEVEEEALALLEKVGMADKKDAYPEQLSGGQQQRVAIARALAT
jgi:polar amino acid transport system ATP-binding protein